MGCWRLVAAAADRCIRFWNTLTGQPLPVHIDTGSQVCNLAWSKHANELVGGGVQDGWAAGAGGQALASQSGRTSPRRPYPEEAIPRVTPREAQRALMGSVVPCLSNRGSREPGWGLSPAGLCTLRQVLCSCALWMRLGAWDPGTVPFLSPR